MYQEMIVSICIADGQFNKLPFKNIAMLIIGLVVPLSIGLLIKWKSERVALMLKRLLKPFSIIFIIFIMTFGVYANYYIFAFFDWKVSHLSKSDSEVLALIGDPFSLIEYGQLFIHGCSNSLNKVG